MDDPGGELWACLMLPSRWLYLRLRKWLLARLATQDQLQEETT